LPETALAVTREETVQEKIVSYAEAFGASPALALAVAHAESCFNPLAKNPNSTAGGIFQYIDSTWKGYCQGDKYNADDNIRCATKMLAEKGGIAHWEASRKEGCYGGWETHLPKYKAMLDT
jgi:soluble lytic murein transglycosylase-like protein